MGEQQAHLQFLLGGKCAAVAVKASRGDKKKNLIEEFYKTCFPLLYD